MLGVVALILIGIQGALLRLYHLQVEMVLRKYRRFYLVVDGVPKKNLR